VAGHPALAPFPSDAPPCRPYSRCRAVCFDPLTQIRDLPLPRDPSSLLSVFTR